MSTTCTQRSTGLRQTEGFIVALEGQPASATLPSRANLLHVNSW